MSTYELTNWLLLAKKIKNNEGLSWDDAQEESKKRLKIGKYKEEQSRSQPRAQIRAQIRAQTRAQIRAQTRAQPKEPALIGDVENIVAEYVDPKTYGILMQYNPQKYTLAKYEPLIAASERRLQDERLTQLDEKYKKKFEVDNLEDLEDLEDLKYEKIQILGENIVYVLKIMEDLGLIINHSDQLEIVDAPHMDWISHPITLLQIPKGMKIHNPQGNLVLYPLDETFKFESGAITDRDDDFPTTLWKLLYDRAYQYLYI